VEGDAKPDLVVHLPGERRIIVDAKTPELDFLSSLEHADLEKRSQALEDHARKLKLTIKSLADRDYPSQFQNSLDHVVLFLPAESLFSAALEGDRDLIVWAANRKIMLATPASLIALLRAVSLSWDQFRQTENTQAIAGEAQELYARVAVLLNHFSGIGEGLAKAGAAFNKALGSYESRVKPSAERLAQLGVSTSGKSLPEFKSVDAVLRLPSADG
jgi:DNA recombination protein RmuC